jgi:hypothetical protein
MLHTLRPQAPQVTNSRYIVRFKESQTLSTAQVGAVVPPLLPIRVARAASMRGGPPAARRMSHHECNEQ